MNLEFIKLTNENDHKIKAVYKILKESGEFLFNNNGLIHWRNPYPLESIASDANVNNVYLILEKETQEYIHTFQLKIKKEPNKNLYIAEINKFATSPRWLNIGIGSKSLEFIEKICIKNNINKLNLIVYDKNIDAIRFYINKGFVLTQTKKTTNFRVCEMTKILR